MVVKLSDYCPPVPYDERHAALGKEEERRMRVDGLLHTITKLTDYDLLSAEKQVLLTAQKTNSPVPKKALTDIINFLDRVGSLGEAL